MQLPLTKTAADTRSAKQRVRSADASIVEEPPGFPRETAGERSEQHVSAVTVKTSGEMCRMRDSRRKAETHCGSDPTAKGIPGTFPGAIGGSMKRHVFRIPRARADGTCPSLARENEQLCIVMFLAILLFCFLCYIMVRLK